MTANTFPTSVNDLHLVYAEMMQKARMLPLQARKKLAWEAEQMLVNWETATKG